MYPLFPVVPAPGLVQVQFTINKKNVVKVNFDKIEFGYTSKSMYIFISLINIFLLIVKCTCTNPGAGTTGNNGYTCSDGKYGFCGADQECYATDEFLKGQWSDGCKEGMFLTKYNV